MSLVVVTVHDGKGNSRDLELPGDIPILVLGPAIAEAIQHPDLVDDDAQVKAVLKFTGTDEVIPYDKSLESAGVVHGDHLQMLIKVIPPALADNEINMRFSGPGFAHHTGRRYPFQGKSILIGRVDRPSGVVSKVLGVDITDLEDPEDHSVSRRHARVLLREGEYLIQDLDSTNGTRINGRRLAPDARLTLQHGDKVQFGDISLFFIWDSQEAGKEIQEERRSKNGDLV